MIDSLSGDKGKQYIAVEIEGTTYKLHRVIWKSVKGEDPEQKRVDHKDRDRTNNKWENLRLDCEGGNDSNRGLNKGIRYKGVRKRKSGSWVASIQYNKNRIHLGTFGTEKEATLAYNTASMELHGDWGYRNHV